MYNVLKFTMLQLTNEVVKITELRQTVGKKDI
jgi:hypothetical protein